jgi:hypothetical protein
VQQQQQRTDFVFLRERERERERETINKLPALCCGLIPTPSTQQANSSAQKNQNHVLRKKQTREEKVMIEQMPPSEKHERESDGDSKTKEKSITQGKENFVRR